MIRLHNDYNRGACEKILEKLAQINGESYDGYGEDTWCEKAAKLIREKCKAPEAAIHFLPGATQANFIVHAAALSPIQSVICPDSGHVYAHEAGSIENTGHSWCLFLQQTERSAQSRSGKWQLLITIAVSLIISANLRWYTFHFLQNGEPFIQSRN